MAEKQSSRGTKRSYDGKGATHSRNGKDGTVHKSTNECSKLPQAKKELSSTTTNTGSHGICRALFHSNPYSFYFNKVKGIDHCFNETCLSLQDILSDFGNLVKSVQFNYLIDVQWLMSQYPSKYKSKPLLIVHGYKERDKISLHEEASHFENIRLCQADLSIPFGTHHTKMMIHLYEEGLRVIVTTANLIESDWTTKTQSIWVSPMFPKRSPSSSEGRVISAGTRFQEELTDYLSAYKKRFLDEWIQIINEHDLSEARVHLVTSVPGRFTTSGGVNYGHLKLKRLLQDELKICEDASSPSMVCQTSSIGSLGNQPDSWLTGEFLTSLLSCNSGTLSKSQDLKIVYPSVENIRTSLEGYMAGGSFPYSSKVASKQTYLKDFMQKWKFETRGRSCAMPHLKSYFLLLKDGSISWYLMTSANLSKAAWGCFEKRQTQFFMRSYEAGILFLPQYFNADSLSPKNVLNEFPVSLDLPLTPYSLEDEPWVYDVSYTDKADSHGRIWKIS